MLSYWLELRCRVVCAVLWLLITPLSAQGQPPDEPPRARAIESLTLQQAHELVKGPILISLHFDNTAPQVIYEDLFRQAGLTPRLSSPDFWTQHAEPLTVRIERKPFWVAVRELEAQSKLTLYSIHGIHEYILATVEEAKSSAPYLRGPSRMSDSFLVIAGDIFWSQYRTLFLTNTPPGDDPMPGVNNNDGALRTLTLYVLPDPKFGWHRAVDVQVDEAVDEKGNSLLTPVTVSGFEPLDTFPAAVRINLMRPHGMSRDMGGPQASRKIARIKGKIRLVFVSASERWEVNDPLNARLMSKELSLSEGREQYLIAKLEPSDHSFRTTYKVERQRVEALPKKMEEKRPLFRSDVLFKMLNDSLSLVDADGQVHRAQGSGGSGSVHDWEYRVSFYYPEARVPVKLVWSIPVEWKETEVPFEFTDLPLP